MAIEPTAQQIADACREVLTPEECLAIAELPPDEAIGHAFTLLLENDIDDPEEFLREKGILE